MIYLFLAIIFLSIFAFFPLFFFFFFCAEPHFPILGCNVEDREAAEEIRRERSGRGVTAGAIPEEGTLTRLRKSQVLPRSF